MGEFLFLSKWVKLVIFFSVWKRWVKFCSSSPFPCSSGGIHLISPDCHCLEAIQFKDHAANVLCCFPPQLFVRTRLVFWWCFWLLLWMCMHAAFCTALIKPTHTTYYKLHGLIIDLVCEDSNLDRQLLYLYISCRSCECITGHIHWAWLECVKASVIHYRNIYIPQKHFL